jgi:uncharacterized HAD superfamily protein
MPELPEQQRAAMTQPNDDFREFLKTEYTNIASAHFAAGNTITNFFQFYLLVIGLPITVAGVVQKLGGSAPTTGTIPGIVQLLADPLVPILALTVGVLGLFLMWYIVTLRFDAIRYARTINGVRKRFYNNARLDTRQELAMRGLPRTITKPRYFEKLPFGGIVCSFATLNAAYIALAAWNTVHNKFQLVESIVGFVNSYGLRLSTTGLIAFADRPGAAETVATVAFIAFFLLHWLMYFMLARYQEHRYWQRQRIGIDIDGVLGDQRTQFAALLPTVVPGKTLNPDSIVHIPLHECNTLQDSTGATIALTEHDEHAVFNSTTYWKQMPAYADAARVVRELHDLYRFRIMIFTYRPWPNPAAYQGTIPKDQWTTRHPCTWLATHTPAAGFGIRPRWWNRLLELSRRSAMTRITKEWLRRQGFVYDTLVVERGNIYVADVRSHGHNRFRFAEREDLRIFVDDDLAKARELADICDIVYLIDQPYNQATDLPNNIVRVKNWTGIKQHIRNNL